MVLYARNDILSFHNPANGHTHSRPVKAGRPVPIWGVKCAQCEIALSDNPAWNPSRYKIPLTPDEEIEAADAKAAAEAAIHQQQLMIAQQAVMAQLAANKAGPDIDPDDIEVTSDPDGPSPDVEAGPKADFETRAADYAVLSKQDLKDLCKDQGLPVSGTVQDLIARLVEAEQ